MIKLKLDPTKTHHPLKNPWRNCIAIGRGYELLRKDLLDHLKILQRDIGYRYCRFHGIFHDDVAVAIRRPDGHLQYQWHQVDKIYDALLEIGLRPFVELNPMPLALASGSQTIFWWKMNVTPPRDYTEWEDLIYQFTSHLVDRYGLDEVRQWYFEVWNEPNLPGFWSGTQQEYWKLYDTSAKAVKRVDPQLRIGGPASSKSSWLTDFLNHCADTNTPVDFVSTHLYPQDEYVQYTDRQGSPHAPGEYFADTIRAGREEVRRSKKPNVPIHWTEWNAMSTNSTANVDWIANATNDSLFGAAFVVKNMLALDDAAETLAWWVASDIFEEGAMPHASFTGTYGLLTIHGIPKASYNAFRLLNKMRGNILPVPPLTTPPGCGAFATRSHEATHLILWNCALPSTTNPTTWKETIELPTTTSEPEQLITIRIKPGAGSCYETFTAMGRPQNLSLTQESLLRAHSTPEHQLYTLTPTQNQIKLEVELKPGEVLYIEQHTPTPTAAPKAAKLDDANAWNKAMSDRSS